MKHSKFTIWGLVVFLFGSCIPGVPIFESQNVAHAAVAATNIYAPTELRMTPASNTDSTVVLAWEKPAVYSNVVKYNIYQPNGDLVGSTDKTYYKVLGLAAETSYSYLVRAQDAYGNESLDSNSVQITTKKIGKRFNVKDYGATGDGVTIETKAIQAAIDAVTPGDTLYFPPGEYVTGGLFLHSHMTVLVDTGAAVKPSPHKSDFLPFVRQRHSEEEPEAYQSLFSAGTLDHTNYGYSVEDIQIIGPGTIGDEENGLELRKEYDQDLEEVGRSYGGGHLLGFNNARNIYMDGLKIRNGMMWTIVPVYSKDITAYNLEVITSQHNGDGFDPNSSEQVYILNSTFQTGDDSSAIKSGINEEGRAIGRPSRYIYYRGDTFNGGHGGIVIGSEMSGGVSDIYAEDCNLIPIDVKSNTVAPGFKIKTSTSRGGYIRNIQVRDSLINKIDLNSNYDKLTVPDIYPPDMSNFRFINLVNNDTAGTSSDNIISLTGAASTPTSDNALKNVQFENVAFTQASLSYTENIFFSNSRLVKGINATHSANVVQDGTVVYDKSFPVNEDFTNYKAGDSLGNFWSYAVTDTTLGAVSIAAEGAAEANSLFMDDRGSGYVQAQRNFAAQTGELTVEANVKFPAPPYVANGVPNGTYATKVVSNNNVLQLLGSNGKPIVSLTTQSSGALGYTIKGATSTTAVNVVPVIPLNTWFSVKFVVNYPEKRVDVYYNGSKVLENQPFYDVSLIPADMAILKTIGPNNNTTTAAQFFLDNIKISSEETVDTGYGILIHPENDKKVIISKGGTLKFTANKTTGGTSTVTWAVCNRDLTPTLAAVIDETGVLTAQQNGDVVVTAKMDDGTQILGMLPIKITGQETMIGYKEMHVTTPVGTVPNLPAQVPVRWDDGSVTYAPVVWDLLSPAAYRQPGTVAISGTVNGYAQRASISVNVTPLAIVEYKPVVIKTNSGVTPDLPQTVVAVYNDKSTRVLPVTWEMIPAVQYAQMNVKGFTVIGSVENSTKPAKANVSVLPDTAFEGSQLILVAADGSGDFRTIQEAISAVPDQNNKRVVIFVKNGLYYEKVLVPESKPYITLLGESEEGVSLTYDDNPKKTAKDGTPLGLGTYTDYTLMIKGHDFIAKNLSVINSSGSGSGQSVAVDVYADKVMFENCKIIGYQDTLLTRNKTDNVDPSNYANNNTTQTYRSYFKNCYIAGSVDFIFGPGTAVFENSEIHSLMAGHITAASTPNGQKYGYVFLNSKLTGEDLLKQLASTAKSVNLGRPWRPYAKTVFLNTYMEDYITSVGWNNFGNTSNQSTAYYGEYMSSGPGANPAARAAWSRQLTDTQAQEYTIANIFSQSGLIGGVDDWDPAVQAPVAEISSIPVVHSATPIGVAPVLPSVIDAVYSDGTTRQVPVIWDAIASEAYTHGGQFTVTGAVYHTTLPAIAIVDVRAGSILTGPQSVVAGQPLQVVFGWSGVTEQVYGLDLTFEYNLEQLEYVTA